jgi:Tfp pilus assembly protein PilV
MLAVVVIVVVVLAVSGLAFYAMHRSKPSRLQLSASPLKLASFSIEVESQSGHPGGELPPTTRE